MSLYKPNAETIVLMGIFFRGKRKDIGLSNRGLKKGLFSHLILRLANVFLSEAEKFKYHTYRIIKTGERART